MKTDRRNFIKIAGVAGTGLAANGMASGKVKEKDKKQNPFAHTKESAEKEHKQLFNMCGYSAPRLEKVRVGFIGLGNRGPVNVDAIAYVEGVEIKALCDKRMVRIENSQNILSKHGLPPARAYGGSEEIWKELCKDPDIDFISIAVPRGPLHAKMATFAMENGKHVAVEAPAASTLDEAWKLVETSERTKKHCMMLENCCYDFFELLTLNMARQGFLGVYSRIHTISGTKGILQKYPLPGRIAQENDEWFNEQQMKELTEKYTPEIVKRMGELAREIGGHGGMDFV